MKAHEMLQQEQDIWDLFTRKEEYQATSVDRYGRFPHSASACRDISEPHASKFLLEHGFRVEYPDEKPFAVCLTHDIDFVYKSIVKKSYAALHHLHNARFSECVTSLLEMRSKKVPWWNFSEIMAIEERYDAKSSFYFMVQDPDDQDYAYSIEDCDMVIKEISVKGWEVGLHGGHTAFNNLDEIKAKKARLEKVLGEAVVGYRNHYLRMQIPDTWEYLADAGFSYDTTLGYSDCVGFRNGMCHPFRPYNLGTGLEIGIIEIPLTVMDTTLFEFLKLDLSTAWNLTQQLIDTVERYNGVLTVLWHNTRFSGDMARFYEKILKYCAEKNAWMTCGADIGDWSNNGHCLQS